MIRVALKGLLGRKFRATLTAFAIVLGVAMVSGTFVFTDTITKGFDAIFTESYENADAVISGKERSTPATTPRAAGFSGRCARKGLGAAGGRGRRRSDRRRGDSDRQGRTRDLLGRRGRRHPERRPSDEQRLNPLTLVAGAWPRGARRDRDRQERPPTTGASRSATRSAWLRVGPARRFRITGIAEFGSMDSLGGATIAVFDLPTAQRSSTRRASSTRSRSWRSQACRRPSWSGQIRPLLPPTAQVKSAAAQAEASTDDVGKELDILEYFLLAFGGIALFVGGFVIANTLAITVAQRMRELATLRTLGASRGRCSGRSCSRRSSSGSSPRRRALPRARARERPEALLEATGIDLPSGGIVFAARTVIVEPRRRRR